MQGRVFLGAVFSSMLLLAGCLDTGTELRSNGQEDEGTAWGLREQALYLSPDGHLAVEIPEAGSIPAGDFVLKWTTGNGAHPQFTGDAEAHWLAPTNASVTLYLTTELPVLPATGLLPDVAVWLGSGRYLPLVASAPTGPLLPGEVATVTFDLPGPALQPDILITDGIDLLVTITMTQHDANGVHILTGPDHPSGVQIETRTGSLLTTLAEPRTETVAGTLPIFDRIIGSAPEEGLSHADHAIAIGENDTLLRIEVRHSGGGHTVDMDMLLLDPDGSIITWGVTPYAHEVIEIVGDALMPYRGETLTLRIGNHLGLMMDYSGTIEQKGG